MFLHSDGPCVSIVSQSPYMTTVGSVGTIYCQASSKPIPTVQWYKDDFSCLVISIKFNFQQVFLVSHTTVYTCVGVNYGEKHIGFTNCTCSYSQFKR